MKENLSKDGDLMLTYAYPDSALANTNTYPALFFALIAFMLFAIWIATMKKASSYADQLNKTKHELDDARQKTSKTQSVLDAANEELIKLRADHAKLTDNFFSLKRELSNKSAAHRKACDALIVLSYERQDLSTKLAAKEKEYNELSKSFGDHIASHDSQPSSAFEAKVYVNKSKPSKYHCVVHGSWKDYKLIPLRSAIEKNYSPCSLCFATLEKGYAYTSDYPKFSNSTNYLIESNEKSSPEVG